MSDDPAGTVEGAAQELNGHQETGAGAALSRIEEIAQRNAHAKKHLDRAIPVEWGGNVVVRFGRVSKRTLMEAARGERRADINFLIQACKEVFVRGENGDLIPCRDADGGEAPVRFDGRLADMFHLNGAETPQKIVLRMYGNELAITAAAKAVYEWQTGQNLDELDPEEVEDLVGEEDAAT